MESKILDWWMSPAVWSYGLAAFAFLGFSIQLAARWRGAKGSRALMVAMGASAVWCAASVAFALTSSALIWLLMRVADGARYGALAYFMVNVLARSDGPQSRGRNLQRMGTAAVPFAVVAYEIVDLLHRSASGGGQFSGHVFIAWLALSVAGLVMAEQIIRRTPGRLKWNIRPLFLALVCIFAYDLVLYSSASLFRALDSDLFAARGLVHAFAIPLLGMAAARNRDWTFDVAVSRGVLVSTASLFIAGGYLLVVALVGYALKLSGDPWAGTVQTVLISGSLLLLLLMLLSGTFRSHVRVFVAKHFFPYRYDYRNEWLRLTQTLAGSETDQTLQQRCVRALADLVESTGGALWMRQDGDGYAQVASLNMPAPESPVPSDSSFIEFLKANGWIVDIREAIENPSRYLGLAMPAWLPAMPGAWLVVPMLNGDDLVAFAVITQPRVRFKLDWEVIDLMKTAARGAAAFLAHSQATEQLVEARKFDAFNRMSAFVVHDLKNLVAQMQLMLRNAARHGAKPEFQRDMLATVEHVVERMNHLMMQLRTGARPVLNAHAVDVGALLDRLVSTHAQGARVRTDASPGLAAMGHEDRLERVIGHLVQNALDASKADDPVTVRAYQRDGVAVVEVRDEGCGMSADFVREQLFRPFSTSKANGMGLGAYESMQYVKSLGGSLTVHSELGTGTLVTVHLRVPVGNAQRRGEPVT